MEFNFNFFSSMHQKIKKHTRSGKLEAAREAYGKKMAEHKKFMEESEKRTQEWEIKYHEACRRNGTQPHYHFTEAPAANGSHPLADRNPRYETSECRLKPK